jgi:hypothetical protein
MRQAARSLMACEGSSAGICCSGAIQTCVSHPAEGSSTGVIAISSATAREPLSHRHCIVFDTIDNDNVVASFAYAAKDSSSRRTTGKEDGNLEPPNDAGAPP